MEIRATIGGGHRIVISPDVFRRVLSLPVRRSYSEEPTSKNGLIQRLKKAISYPSELLENSDVLKVHVDGVFKFLLSSISHCLSRKTGSHDQLNLSEAAIAYGIICNQNMDYGKIFFDQLAINFKSKIRTHLIRFPRFLSLIFEDLLPKVVSLQQIEDSYPIPTIHESIFNPKTIVKSAMQIVNAEIWDQLPELYQKYSRAAFCGKPLNEAGDHESVVPKKRKQAVLPATLEAKKVAKKRVAVLSEAPAVESAAGKLSEAEKVVADVMESQQAVKAAAVESVAAEVQVPADAQQAVKAAAVDAPLSADVHPAAPEEPVEMAAESFFVEEPAPSPQVPISPSPFGAAADVFDTVSPSKVLPVGLWRHESVSSESVHFKRSPTAESSSTSSPKDIPDLTQEIYSRLGNVETSVDLLNGKVQTLSEDVDEFIFCVGDHINENFEEWVIRKKQIDEKFEARVYGRLDETKQALAGDLSEIKKGLVSLSARVDRVLDAPSSPGSSIPTAAAADQLSSLHARMDSFVQTQQSQESVLSQLLAVLRVKAKDLDDSFIQQSEALQKFEANQLRRDSKLREYARSNRKKISSLTKTVAAQRLSNVTMEKDIKRLIKLLEMGSSQPGKGEKGPVVYQPDQTQATPAAAKSSEIKVSSASKTATTSPLKPAHHSDEEMAQPTKDEKEKASRSLAQLKEKEAAVLEEVMKKMEAASVARLVQEKRAEAAASVAAAEEEQKKSAQEEAAACVAAAPEDEEEKDLSKGESCKSSPTILSSKDSDDDDDQAPISSIIKKQLSSSPKLLPTISKQVFPGSSSSSSSEIDADRIPTGAGVSRLPKRKLDLPTYPEPKPLINKGKAPITKWDVELEKHNKKQRDLDLALALANQLPIDEIIRRRKAGKLKFINLTAASAPPPPKINKSYLQRLLNESDNLSADIKSLAECHEGLSNISEKEIEKLGWEIGIDKQLVAEEIRVRLEFLNEALSKQAASSLKKVIEAEIAKEEEAAASVAAAKKEKTPPPKQVQASTAVAAPADKASVIWSSLKRSKYRNTLNYRASSKKILSIRITKPKAKPIQISLTRENQDFRDYLSEHDLYVLGVSEWEEIHSILSRSSAKLAPVIIDKIRKLLKDFSDAMGAAPSEVVEHHLKRFRRAFEQQAAGYVPQLRTPDFSLPAGIEPAELKILCRPIAGVFLRAAKTKEFVFIRKNDIPYLDHEFIKGLIYKLTPLPPNIVQFEVILEAIRRHFFYTDKSQQEFWMQVERDLATLYFGELE